MAKSDLRNLRTSTVQGDVAETPLYVSGIKPQDTLLTVIDISSGGLNLVSEFEIPAVDYIRSMAEDTTSTLLFVQWAEGHPRS